MAGCIMGMLGACASNTVATYEPDNSDALNIMHAAGIDSNLKDTEVPKDTISSITDSAGYGFAMAASGYKAPIPGVSSSQMAGMNFTAWLFSPTADSARNSLFAWVPKDIAGDNAIDSLADILLEAASKAAKELGYDPEISIPKNKTGTYLLMTRPGDEYCEKGSKYSCMIAFGLREAQKLKEAPDFVGTVGANSFFDPSERSYSFFTFNKEYVGFNELELLVTTSKHLPKWVYFYVAPKNVRFNELDKMKIPAVVNQGKLLYFVKPASS